MKIPLHRVAEWLALHVESDAVVTGWSVDSRTIQPGDLFFALRGPNQDGHAYIAQALQKGAAAVVAEVGQVPGLPSPIFRVEDSLKALETLAASARRDWGGE